MSVTNTILSNIQSIITGLTSFTTVYLGLKAYRKNNEINKLKEEKEYLRKKIHKITSKVNPESDRVLIKEANATIGMIGINSLGPLHHCREEIIDFLKIRKGSFKIILLDPESKIFKERALKEGDKSNRLISEWKASLTILKDIKIQSGKEISLRLRTDPPDRSLLIIDAFDDISEKSKMLINYYPDEPNTRGYSGGQFLSEFTMERDRDSFFKNIEYFENTWGKSKETNLDEL